MFTWAVYSTCIRPVIEYACQAFHDSLPKYLSDDFKTSETNFSNNIPRLTLQRSIEEHKHPITVR